MSEDTSQVARLVLMANQIVRNLAIQGEARAVETATAHMRNFWDPRMRSALTAYVADGGEGLAPMARAAVLGLAEPRA